MKAVIEDADALAAVRPSSIAGYLRAQGWQIAHQEPGRFIVWRHDIYTDAEIMAPLASDTTDYALQVRSALHELEAVEGRSQLDILRDLYNAGFDVVRIAAVSEGLADGTVNIEDGVQLFERVRDILLASACATVRPQAVYYSRKPLLANEYMSRARLGQTEQGSYVVTVLSPLDPHLSHPQSELFPFEPPEPFARAVIKTLTRSVSFALSAAQRTTTSSDFAPFQEAVREGVSANLCEGIAGLFETPIPSAIEISVAWALNQPTPNVVPVKLRIDRDVASTLAQAARLFREYDALEGYTLQGPVIRLQRNQDSAEGMVTIFAPVEDVLRKITFTLPTNSYDAATQAHLAHRFVRVTGNLVRTGRSYQLLDPSSFTVAEPYDDDVLGTGLP